jgi:hypothetical protein
VFQAIEIGYRKEYEAYGCYTSELQQNNKMNI